MSDGEEKSASPLPRPLAFVRWLDRGVQRVEVAVCLGSLALMILFAFAQVFLRAIQGAELLRATFSFLPEPVAWFDNVARHLVIWVGVLGASLATAEGRHISIEAFPKLLSERGRRVVDVVVSTVSFGVSLVLFTLCSIYMIKLQMHDGSELFIVQAIDLKVQRWPFLLVVPLGLALISWRFGLRAIEGLILDDATYKALRDQEQAREMAEVDATQEEHEVELLLDHARKAAKESGVVFSLDAETARAHVRDALHSDRLDAHLESGPEQGADALSDDELDEHERGAALDPGAAPPSRPRRPEVKLGLRSTDEIPTYSPTDLHDDEDKADPVMQRGAPRELDSSDMIDAVSDIADMVGLSSGHDAEDAIEAVVDTTRLHDPDPSDAAAPLPPGDDPNAVTQRVPLELPEANSIVALPDAADRVVGREDSSQDADAEGPPHPDADAHPDAHPDADTQGEGGES